MSRSGPKAPQTSTDNPSSAAAFATADAVSLPGSSMHTSTCSYPNDLTLPNSPRSASENGEASTNVLRPSGMGRVVTMSTLSAQGATGAYQVLHRADHADGALGVAVEELLVTPAGERVRQGRQQLEADVLVITDLDERIDDRDEVDVRPAGRGPVRVGEVHMLQDACAVAVRVGERGLLDVHVEGVPLHATVGQPGLGPQAPSLLQPVEEIRLEPVPALEGEADTARCGVLPGGPDGLDGPLPLLGGIGERLDFHVGRRMDDHRRAIHRRGEVDQVLDVLDRGVASIRIRVDQVALGSVDRANAADADAGILGQLRDALGVDLLRLAHDLDRVVAETRHPIHRDREVLTGVDK